MLDSFDKEFKSIMESTGPKFDHGSATIGQFRFDYRADDSIVISSYEDAFIGKLVKGVDGFVLKRKGKEDVLIKFTEDLVNLLKHLQ